MERVVNSCDAGRVPPRKPYPSDTTEEEWAFLAPYLVPMRLDAPQRAHDRRAVFSALRCLVRPGCPWRLIPPGLLPWDGVCQQAPRWLAAAVRDSRTLQSTPESGGDRARHKRGSNGPWAVDTLGHFLARHVTVTGQDLRTSEYSFP